MTATGVPIALIRYLMVTYCHSQRLAHQRLQDQVLLQTADVSMICDCVYLFSCFQPATGASARDGYGAGGPGDHPGHNRLVPAALPPHSEPE